jgi:hypothetical protein
MNLFKTEVQDIIFYFFNLCFFKKKNGHYNKILLKLQIFYLSLKKHENEFTQQ